MAAKFDLMPMQPFNPDTEPNTSAERWKKWVRRFQRSGFDVAVTKLTVHFNPMKNTEFTVYSFRQARQW